MQPAAAFEFDSPGAGLCSAGRRATLFTLFTADARPLLAVDPRAGATVNRQVRALHGRHSRVLAWAILAESVELLLVGDAASGTEHAVRLLKRRTESALRALGHGRIWQRGFAALPIRPCHDLRAVLAYVLAAPERADLVDRWTDWPWCGSQQWPAIDRELLARHPSGLFWLDAMTSNGLETA